MDKIATKNIIHFSENHEDICKRVCNNLNINIFPDYSGEKYWTLNSGNWQSHNLDKEQRVFIDKFIFDEDVITKFEKSSSQLLFCLIIVY
ncbi:hypothetical protein [Nibrella saemangeumensis]